MCGNRSFSDPICTENMAKSLHLSLLAAPDPCGGRAPPDLAVFSQSMPVFPPIPSEVKAEPCVHNTSHWLHMRDKVQTRVWKLQSADRCLCGSPASSSRSSHLGRLYLIICMRRLSFCLNADRWKRDECEWARISCHSANLIFCQHFARFISELLFGEREKIRYEGKGDGTISRHRGPIFKPQTSRSVQRTNVTLRPWQRGRRLKI